MLDWLDASWVGPTSWTLMWVCLIVGILGTLLPFLPGPLIVFCAAVIHKIGVPNSEIGITGLVVLTILLIAAYIVDFLGSAAGARWFGSSRWGVAGVIIGGLVGLFFGLPGMLIGPLIGGFGFELMFARKDIKDASKSTWGTIVGTVAGLSLKIVIALIMTTVILVDLFVWRQAAPTSTTPELPPIAESTNPGAAQINANQPEETNP